MANHPIAPRTEAALQSRPILILIRIVKSALPDVN